MRRNICLTALAVLLAACQQERPETTAFHIAEADSWTVRTRSLLAASDIETRKTGITLAAYADGTLAAAGHFETGLDAMVLELEPDRPHTLYALVNMGDMTGALPLSESELNTITYRIPSYTEGTGSLASRGIPMAGRLSWPGQGTVIPVRRLLAKVTARLSCDWAGASIRSVRVCNLNRMLRPFGDAVREEDWDQQEFQEGTGASSGTFVFYVPENRQGTIGGIQSSLDKSPDRNTTVRSKQDALTYLETSVTSTESAYAGDITYRSYLGGNATTDFDIERNGLYDWTVVYHGDRTQDQDWKRDGDIFQVVVTADKTDAYVGETVRLTASCRRNDHGAETVTDVTDDAAWTKLAGGSATIGISKGEVTATAPGTASFRAGFTLNGRTAYGDSPTITFRELPPLTVSWTEQAAYVGQRGSFTVSDLAEGATITNVTSSNERIAAKAAVSGRTVYVNLLGASGDATLTIKASNGQTGTISVSPAAPYLLDTNGASVSYYGHPDGTDVNTNASGHGGLPPSFGYYTGTTVSLSTRISVGTDASQTTAYTGRTFAPDLYETILKPVLTVSDPSRFGTEGTGRIWVKSLIDYPSSGGVAIGTFTASPALAGCGVIPLTEAIYSVNPFTGITSATTWPDFHDKGMLVQYVNCEEYHRNIRIPDASAVNAAASALGWDVKMAGEWNATMKSRFTGNDNYLYFDYAEGDALPHIGGLCEVQRTVTNPYSGEKIGRTFLSFNVIVWGAVGGSVAIVTNSQFEVRPAYIGPGATKPTGQVFHTSYADGEDVKIYGDTGNKILNGTVSRDDAGHSLGQAVYTVTLSNGDVKYNAQVYRSIHPCVTFTAPSDPYYRIEMLEDIQTKVIHPDYHPGWVIATGGPTDPPID
jgi:hypothetical protein